MSGLYIHIPFCKQACDYCNFHFSTSLQNKNELLNALVLELKARAKYLDTKTLESVYFGGGTPSLLSVAEIRALLDEAKAHFSLSKDVEITLEANPDDLDSNKLRELKTAGINRLSLGIQSFHEADLKFMNRVHDTSRAHRCIKQVKEAGFHNYSIDLIYGTPGLSEAAWRSNLEQVRSYEVPHLSAYALTVEPKTVLAYRISKGLVPDVDEDLAANQFNILMDFAEEAGYEHYEISNFCQPGHQAKHNSSYWQGAAYLGIGPSAHSFNGKTRSWNINHNTKYIKALETGDLPLETEHLSTTEQYNEYLMISLRTAWGYDPKEVKKRFGEAAADALVQGSQKYLSDQLMETKGTNFRLTRKGKLLADHIIADLFME